MELTGKKILITGGFGFIGTNFILYLINKKIKCHLRIIDNLSSSIFNKTNYFKKVKKFTDNNLKKNGIFFLRGDIKNYSKCLEITKNVDIIIHLAASAGVAQSIDDPKSDFQNNLLGTINLLEASRINKVIKFVFASSGAVLAGCNPPFSETLKPHVLSPYGSSKLSSENYLESYHHSYGLDTVSLRFSNVYGPYSLLKQSVIAKFINNILTKKDIDIYGNGNQIRDFIYVDDLVSCIYKIIKSKKIPNRCYQLSSSKGLTVNHLIKQLTKYFKGTSYPIKINYKSKRIGDPHKSYANNSLIQKDFKWKPKINIEKGINKTIANLIKMQKL